MNCQEVMELIQRHVDQDLNEQETLLMTDHVGQCPECAAMLEKLTRLSRGLEQLPRVEPPYSLVDAILPQLTQEENIQSSESEHSAGNRRRVNRTRQSWIARISGVVALGVVVAIFAINGPDFGGKGSSAQKEASFTAQSADFDASGASQLRSDALRKEMAAQDQHGKEMPADEVQPKTSLEFAPGQAPSSALSGESRQADGQNLTDETVDPPRSVTGLSLEGEEAISPDGKWKAVLADGALRLYRADSDEPAFETAPDSGIRSSLVWQDDSTAIHYTYINADGATSERSLLVPEMKEIEREAGSSGTPSR